MLRALAPFAERCYHAQTGAAQRLRRARARHGARVVCREVARARRDPLRLGLEADRPTLFAVGGSLRARGLNAALAEGLARAAP